MRVHRDRRQPEPVRARTVARWSALGSLAVGAAGQIAYHLMTAVGMTHAPAPIVAAVACLPVAVLGMGAALAHLAAHDQTTVHPAAALDTTPDTPAVRLDTAAARAAIEDAYTRGLSVREAAALSTRSASYLGQAYSRLRDADTLPGQLAFVSGGH